MSYEWKKGMRVVKMFYGLEGYREASEGVITKIDKKNKTIYVDDETGITYAFDGREKENFFPGMRKEITPLY